VFLAIIRGVGIALWTASGIAVFVVARFVPIGRSRRRIAELVTAILAAGVCGVVSTALDFGGWGELDWRAGVLALLGAAAAVAVFRLVTFSPG
jgi:hypothetical protein